MLKDTIAKIETIIKKIRSIEHAKKAALIRLLSKLKSEISELPETHVEHAKSIAGFAEIATHEALRKNKSPRLQELSQDGLSSAVKGFENSHPKLVEIVNELSLLLSRLGI